MGKNKDENTKTNIRHGQKQRRKYKDKREAIWAKKDKNTKTNIRHGQMRVLKMEKGEKK